MAQVAKCLLSLRLSAQPDKRGVRLRGQWSSFLPGTVYKASRDNACIYYIRRVRRVQFIYQSRSLEVIMAKGGFPIMPTFPSVPYRLKFVNVYGY